MPSVFISYRRPSTSADARGLRSSLAERLGADQVFRDVDAEFRGGDRFGPRIRAVLAESRVFLAVIGLDWLGGTAPGRRRIDDPEDWVHTETHIALRSDDVRVIPILVQGAKALKAADLPEALQDLAGIQAMPLRDEDYEHDLGRIVREIEESLATGSGTELPTPRDYSVLRHRATLAAGGEVFSVAISPDGRTVAAGTVGAVLLWRSDQPVATWVSARKRRPDHRLPDPARSYVYVVRFSPDGRRLASANQAGQVSVASLEPLHTEWTEEVHDDAIYSLSFSPDGVRLASGGYDQRVRVVTMRSRAARLKSEHSARISAVAWCPRDGSQLIAAASHDDSIHLWDTLSGDFLAFPKGHLSSVEGLAFSPDGTLLASCGLDKAVRVWDVSTPEPSLKWSNVRYHKYLVRCVAFSPDGRTLASGGWDDSILLWRAEDGALIDTGWGETQHDDWIWSVDFSRVGTCLASGGADGLVKLWSSAEAP